MTLFQAEVTVYLALIVLELHRLILPIVLKLLVGFLLASYRLHKSKRCNLYLHLDDATLTNVLCFLDFRTIIQMNQTCKYALLMTRHPFNPINQALFRAINIELSMGMSQLKISYSNCKDFQTLRDHYLKYLYALSENRIGYLETNHELSKLTADCGLIKLSQLQIFPNGLISFAIQKYLHLDNSHLGINLQKTVLVYQNADALKFRQKTGYVGRLQFFNYNVFSTVENINIPDIHHKGFIGYAINLICLPAHLESIRSGFYRFYKNLTVWSSVALLQHAKDSHCLLPEIPAVTLPEFEEIFNMRTLKILPFKHELEGMHN